MQIWRPLLCILFTIFTWIVSSIVRYLWKISCCKHYVICGVHALWKSGELQYEYMLHIIIYSLSLKVTWALKILTHEDVCVDHQRKSVYVIRKRRISDIITWDSSGPFYWHGLTLISAWISNYMANKVWDEITYPFLNFNGATVEV